MSISVGNLGLRFQFDWKLIKFIAFFYKTRFVGMMVIIELWISLETKSLCLKLCNSINVFCYHYAISSLQFQVYTCTLTLDVQWDSCKFKIHIYF